MKLKIAIHNFRTNPKNSNARDGANFAYSEGVQLLNEYDQTIQTENHDFYRLCRDNSYAYSVLKNCDCVVSNVGPHAYIYFYLRNKFHLNFRIVRDVRTALWNGYLMQEFLLAPYLREQDTVIFSSAYSRDLFKKLFPHIRHESMFVCYPLMHFFPAQRCVRLQSRLSEKSPLMIGYIGRLTPDKNFSQALDLIINLEKNSPGRYHLHAVGECLFSRYQLKSIQRRLKAETGNPEIYTWCPPVTHDQIWNEYSKMDILFFPSTSNLETFGRVLIEASYWEVPILSSTAAAASELLSQESLLPTKYFTDQDFDTHRAYPLGQVDIQVAMDKLAHISKLPGSSSFYTRYSRHDQLYFNILHEGNKIHGSSYIPTTEQQGRFIRSVFIRGLEQLSSVVEANNIISELRNFFTTIQDFGSPKYYMALAKLLIQSRYPAKTLNFVQRSTNLHEDFTNIGGIDLQMAHIIKFYPHYIISPQDSIEK